MSAPSDARRGQFPEYNSEWKKADDDDLEKPFLDPKLNAKADCYGLDKDGQMAAEESRKARRQLICASILCFTFLIAELVGGFLANSLAIMTDAAHLLSDIAGFMISLTSMYLANRPASDTHSFGYHRAEILGSLVSVLLIWLLTGLIVYEAIGRFQKPEDVEGKLMFGVAALGLTVNFAMGMVLMQSGHAHSHGGLPGGGHHHSHGEEEEDVDIISSFPSRGGLITPMPRSSSSMPHDDIEQGHEHGPPPKKKQNINVQAAFIHVIGDALQSVGVMIAAGLIWYNPEYKLADPMCSFVFAVLVLFTTMRLIWQASHILMEGMPDDVNAESLRKDLGDIPGVLEVHDLHIWSISVGKTAMSVHLYVDDRAENVLTKATNVCNSKHHIFHVTIQVETEKEGKKICHAS